MSAIVCGKRSFFEDLPSPSVSKRIRPSSSSPVRFSPPRSIPNRPSLIFHLLTIYPGMDKQLIEKALEECGDNLDSAIRSLNELRLGSAHRNPASVSSKPVSSREGDAQLQAIVVNEEVQMAADLSAPSNLSVDGLEWVEIFVREMTSASNIDDAKARTSRALEVLEKSIRAQAGAETAHNVQQENMILKEQVQTLIHENGILKRVFAIQHERQKEIEDKSQELQQLKQLASQYQEQLRTLEMNNYALTMHLKQAQQSNSIPGSFHPDVF